MSGEIGDLRSDLYWGYLEGQFKGFQVLKPVQVRLRLIKFLEIILKFDLTI